MTKPISRVAIVALIAGIASLSTARDSFGQPAEPDVVRVKTVDGLNLWGKWFQGGKGNKSDTVIMVHGYGSQCSKGPWEDLAKSLQAQDFSVLMFDLRGHGESAKNRALQDWATFCEYPYNRLSGYPLNPKANTQEISRLKFQPAYYPFLINDLAAARRFVDVKNDGNHCNAGRIFIIAEGSISPLVMMSVSTEYLRNGIFPSIIGADAPEHPAGRDYGGIVFLSWSGTTGLGQSSAFNVTQTAWKHPEIWQDKYLVGDRVREKISMMFIYGKEDTASAGEARRWFDRFYIAKNKKEDTITRKYLLEVPAAKLAGINLMDVMVDEKIKKKVDGADVEMIVKVSMVQQQIISFIKGTVENGKNGDLHKTRHVATQKLFPVPLDKLGLK